MEVGQILMVGPHLVWVFQLADSAKSFYLKIEFFFFPFFF